jgi:hypothetical protein
MQKSEVRMQKETRIVFPSAFGLLTSALKKVLAQGVDLLGV